MNPDVYDASCDYCGKQVGRANVRMVRIGRSTSWLCERCKARQEERYAAEVGAAPAAQGAQSR